MKLTYEEARDLAEALKAGEIRKSAVKATVELLRAYIRDVQGAGPRGPHTVMPDRGASPRASFGSMRGGTKSYSNR